MTIIGNNPNQIPTNADLGAMAYRDHAGVLSVGCVAPTIGSAATIQPRNAITFVSGTTTVSTITPPPELLRGGQVTLIPTGLWSTDTSGNVALATTAVVNKALVMFYDSGTQKWYPSY